MLAFGIDIGYAAVKTALINDKNQVVLSFYALHRGDIQGTVESQLKKLMERFSPRDLHLGAVTGSGRDFPAGRIMAVNDVAALVEGCRAASTRAGSVVEIGAQIAKYITGLKNEAGNGINISINANCSSGTGSFLEEQMSRLNLNLEDYSVYAARAKSIPRIAGRCSVFAKTDITHHQQEGVPVEDILLGLAYAVVRNFRVGVMKKLPMETPILFSGGVAHNQGVVRAFKDVLGLGEEDLIIPEHFSVMGAVGAAIIAFRENLETDIYSRSGLVSLSADTFDSLPGRAGSHAAGKISLPPLVSFGLNDSLDKHNISTPAKPDQPFYMGIDVGSTSTNLVLVTPEKQIMDYRYLRTKGDPVAAVNLGLEEFKATYGEGMNILGTGVTGSGRYLIGKMVGTDIVKDEITAQAKAAVTLDPAVDTIFEIGGQDSKFIRIKDVRVADFQMNKVCAAGTGSFIEEQAQKFDIPIESFGPMALNSNDPVDLGERCTVFIETTLAAHLAQGVKTSDLAAGLCYSVVKNYLNRVVGQKKIGNRILFQGGLGHNQGVVNAFRAVLGKNIQVPLFFSVTGALGAALLAMESVRNSTNLSQKSRSSRSIFPKKAGENRFNSHVQDLIFEGYTGVLDPGKKTVGLPKALFTFGMFSMFHAFFKTLGFNVLLSPSSDHETISLAQEHSLDETCFPIKLVNGHIAWLVAQKVDYIFFPDLYTVHHPDSESRQNYGCAYMQLAFKLANQAMELERTGITLLAPTIAFHLGPEFMANSFISLGRQLNRGKDRTMAALGASMGAFQDFQDRLVRHGKAVLKEVVPDEKVFVLVSKIYGVADPVLNLGIPDRLAQMGYKTISFFDLPEGNIFQEHPNMYWPFIQHILDPAFLIRKHPNFFAILLTHHGCGPDSVASHFFGEIMSDKPFLNIEVDEHSSTVGVMTRLEAFVDSISHIPVQKAHTMDRYQAAVSHLPVHISRDIKHLPPDSRIFLPNIFPYSSLFREILAWQEIPARVLPQTDEKSLNRGRLHTTANEYFSLTALLGDVLEALDRDQDPDTAVFFIPQTEGAEVDGQYSRFIRTRLDGEGFSRTALVSPFIEDGISEDLDLLHQFFLGVLAGDLVRLAPARHRRYHLSFLTSLLRRKRLDLDNLTSLAQTIGNEVKAESFKKQIFVTGDPLALFNDFLTGNHFSWLESLAYRVIYAPMSEYLLMFWKDWAEQNGKKRKPELMDRIQGMWAQVRALDMELSDVGAFAKNPDSLFDLADKTLGYYAGTNGRYRMAKCLDQGPAVDGIITVSPMYENTGISLNALGRQFSTGFPLLNLTLDGNRNQADRTRIEAFLFYL